MTFLTSWVSYGQDSHFPIQNIPFAIFQSKANPQPRVASAVGDYVIDLSALAKASLFKGPLLSSVSGHVFNQKTLNAFMTLGRPAWIEARLTIQGLLSSTPEDATLRDNEALRAEVLIPMTDVSFHLPVEIGDYTDFYASKEHATNVGIMFRGKENALMPNWLHIPIGYHGRSSSIVVSGTPIRRPNGQIKPAPDAKPIFAPSRRLDFELEMSFFVGPGNKHGEPIPISQADNHIFGLGILNDWSARDIQAWEYQPLGPFLGKNFGSTLSPWIITLEALDPFRVATPIQEPQPLEYLDESKLVPSGFDINLEVQLKPKGHSSFDTICVSNMKYMYWSIRQQLTHHSCGGCNLRTGDMCGTGTISGSTPDSFGSLLELSWNGSKPLEVAGGAEKRTFILDGDSIRMTAYAQGNGYRIGFGECVGEVLPAVSYP